MSNVFYTSWLWFRTQLKAKHLNLLIRWARNLVYENTWILHGWLNKIDNITKSSVSLSHTKEFCWGHIDFITLGAHAQLEYDSCVCLSVCVHYLDQILWSMDASEVTPRAIYGLYISPWTSSFCLSQIAVTTTISWPLLGWISKLLRKLMIQWACCLIIKILALNVHVQNLTGAKEASCS